MQQAGSIQFSSTGGTDRDDSKSIRESQNTLWSTLWIFGLIISVIVTLSSLTLDILFGGLLTFIFSEFFICMVWKDSLNPLRQGCRIPDPNVDRNKIWQDKTNTKIELAKVNTS